MKSEEFFQTHPVFTHDEYAESREGGSPRTVDSLLRKHIESGRIARIRRGLYVSVSFGSSPESADPYLIASKASHDAVISHHAALQFHGRSYSIWNQITFLTSSHARGFEFGPTEFKPVRLPVALESHSDVGIQTLASGGGWVRVCTLERAMVDVLHEPSLAGGWEEIWRSLEMIEFFDLDALISYTLSLESALTVARVGFFLTQHRERLFVEEEHFKRLLLHAPKDPRYFDSSRTTGRLVHPWNLIVPQFILEQHWEEVA